MFVYFQQVSENIDWNMTILGSYEIPTKRMNIIQQLCTTLNIIYLGKYDKSLGVGSGV